MEENCVPISYYPYENDREKKYTLGSIYFPVGLKPGYRGNVDTTFRQYCHEILLIPSMLEEFDVDDWINSICDSVELLHEPRNHASHGGYTTSREDAIETFCSMLLIEQIMIKLVAPCRL